MRRKIETKERTEIWQKMKSRCGYCGIEITLKQMQVDHIIPHRNGGTCNPENLLASCRPCNHRKGTSTVESFREQLENQLDVLVRDSATYRNALRYGQVVEITNPIVFYFERKESEEPK